MTVVAALAETPLILDNDIFTHWRNQQRYVLDAIAEYQARVKRPPSLASTTVFEALLGIELAVAKHGIAETKAKVYRDRVQELSELCGVLSFDQKAAIIAAYVCAHLGDNLFRKHWRDIFIAATAVAHGHGIATGNRRDFELIGNALPAEQPPLRLAIWKP